MNLRLTGASYAEANSATVGQRGLHAPWRVILTRVTSHGITESLQWHALPFTFHVAIMFWVLRMAFGHLFVQCDLCIVKASQASQASLETEDPGASITTCHRVGRLGREAEGHVSPCFYHRQGHTSEFAWETQIAQIWKSQMLQMILHHLFIIFHENVSNSVPFPGWQWITSRCHGVNRVTSCQQVMDFKVRSADDQNLQGMKASKSVSKKLRQISIKIS